MRCCDARAWLAALARASAAVAAEACALTSCDRRDVSPRTVRRARPPVAGPGKCGCCWSAAPPRPPRSRAPAARPVRPPAVHRPQFWRRGWREQVQLPAGLQSGLRGGGYAGQLVAGSPARRWPGVERGQQRRPAAYLRGAGLRNARTGACAMPGLTAWAASIINH